MTRHIKELNHTPAGADGADPERWQLVFNERAQDLHVRHEWAHGLEGRRHGSRMGDGFKNYTIEDFMVRTHADSPGAKAAKQHLIETIRRMFEAERP